MFDFDRAVVGTIPLHEASSFFVSVKTAGWKDPPDITGQLEGEFSVPVEQAIDAMKMQAQLSLRLHLACSVFSQSLRGPDAKKLECCLHGCEWTAKDSADYLIKRMSVLGGPVHLDPVEPPPATTDPMDATKLVIRALQEAIAGWRGLVDLLGENPMQIRCSQFAENLQGNLDSLWKSLPMSGEGEGEETPELAGAEDEPAEGSEEDVPEEAAEAAGGEEEEEPEEPEEPPPPPAAGGEEKQARVNPFLLAGGLGASVGGLAGGAEQGWEGAAKGAVGGGLGAALGTAGGGASGELVSSFYGGMPTGTGLAAGRVAGGIGGGYAGYKAMMNAFEKNAGASLSMRFKLAALKLAQGEGSAEGAPEGSEMSAPTPPPAPGTPTGPTQQPLSQMAPDQYLAAEQMAQQAQQQNEAGFYREKMREAHAQMQGMQQQVDMSQQQMQQLQQQAASAGAEIQQAQSTAQQATSQALQQSAEAARMRMGLQAIQSQMFNVASQDPATVGAQSVPVPGQMPGQTPSPEGVPPEEGPPAPGSTPGGAPAPGLPAGAAIPSAAGPIPPAAPGPGAPSGAEQAEPTTVPPGAGEQPSATKEGQAGQAALNIAKDRLPYALAGGALGAGAAGAGLARGTEGLRQQVQSLESKDTGGFTQALRMAKSKAQLAHAEAAQKHPGAALGLGALTGAATGAILGPSIHGEAKRLGQNIGTLAR